MSHLSSAMARQYHGDRSPPNYEPNPPGPNHLVGAGSGSPRPPHCRHDMLTQPQEANLVTYNVGLCRMVNGNLDAPYEGASIEAVNIPDALLKAKKWAASVEVADNSWLQILLDGRSVRSLKPGSF